uniref:Uncharacterized protein n=1 Tax=Tetradesmus obliquus TaxID=3088 RepID=A0A383V1I0_TETOB|eukprot:jgi/Sobl393_1/2927/SZX59417.1
MSLSAERTCSEDRELLLELLNLASTGCSEQQRQDGVAILKRLSTEVVWDVMLELHSSGQQAVLCNGTIDQRRIAEQLADSTDAADAVATACDRACSPGCFDGNTALEHPAAAIDKAETDSSTFSLAQVPKAGNQALTPRLGDVQDHDQSPDRAVPEQQRQSVSHRVLAALQQREVAAAGARALGSMDLMIGSLDVHKSTADFCLLPGSHGEEQAACTTVELAAELNSSASPAGASAAAAAAAAAAAVQRRHTMDAPHSCQDAQSYRPAPPRAATASANELRQSAVDGLKSFQLVIRTEGDWEDTASESAYSGVVTPTASPAYSMHTPTVAAAAAAGFGTALHSPASSCHTPASVVSARAVPSLPGFSSTSSNSSRTPASAQQVLKQKQQKPSGIGLSRAINALRRSITGRKQLKGQEQPAAATASRNTSAASAGSMAPGRAAAAGSKTTSPPSSLVQGRLGSFTETERVRAATATGGGSSSSKGSVSATSSGYRPPGAAGSKVIRTPMSGNPSATAAHRSPLGRAPTTPASASGRSVAGSPAPSTSAAAAAAALLSRIPSSGGSAPRTPAAAQSPFSPASAEQRTPVAASPAASAGLAWLKQHSEPYSAPVSPCPSRPESVASQYSVASTSKLGATRMAGQLPGFAVTKQMVAGTQPAAVKQQPLQRTPGSAPRPSPAAAATGSRAGYTRPGASPAAALAAAAAAAASRAGASRLPAAAAASATAAKGSSRMATASPFAAAGAAGGASRPGFGNPGGASRPAGSRCDSQIGLQRVPAAAAAAGRRAAGGHELRRSRSHGSLADLLHQEKRTDVSELRKMWQQLEVQHAMKYKQGTAIDRLALRPHTQQQEASSSAAAAAAAAQPSSLSRPISSTGCSRIPAFGSRLPSAPGVAPAAAAAAAVSQAPSRELQGPEACESPPTSPIGLTRRSSRGSRGTGISDCSDTGHPAAAAAGAGVAGAAVDASFVQGKMMGGLISRLDDMLQQELPAQVHSAPLGPAAMPAAGSDGINRQLF